MERNYEVTIICNGDSNCNKSFDECIKCPLQKGYIIERVEEFKEHGE